MSIGSRIKERREELGLTQLQLAEALGVTSGAISNYETDSNSPKASILYRVFEVLHCDANYIFQDEIRERRENSASPEEMNLIKLFRSLDDYGRETVKYLLERESARAEQLENASAAPAVPAPAEYIRLYRTPAAAGFASPVEGSDYTLIPRDKKTPRNADFAVRIQGSSMSPYIKDGDTVYVQRDTSLEDFDVGIFYLDGDMYCKQICVDVYGNVYLLSANPKKENLNKTVSHDSTSTLICYGKVILPHKLPPPKYHR